MDAAEYNRLRQAAERPGLRCIGEAWASSPGDERKYLSPVAAVVKRAARLLRRRERAAKVWANLVRPEELRHTSLELDSTAGDCVVVVVDSAPLHAELQRSRVTWERHLARSIPGVRRLRFVVGTPGAAPK